MLDKTKPYSQSFGKTDYRYMQDGIKYDVHGQTLDKTAPKQPEIPAVKASVDDTMPSATKPNYKKMGTGALLKKVKAAGNDDITERKEAIEFLNDLS